MNAFTGKTYGAALTLLKDRFGPREALRFQGRSWSFADVKAEVDRASARLAGLGLDAGDKVALWLTNRPEYLWYWLGAAQMGMVAVLLNTRLTGAEVTYQLGHSDTRAILLPGAGAFRDFLGEIADICPAVRSGRPGMLNCSDFPALRHVISLDPFASGLSGVTDWSRATEVSLPVPPAAADPDATAMIAYSSGTTALPKGVMLTHSVWRKAADHGERFGQTEEDRLYLCVPLFGILANVNGVLTFWTRGSSVVLDERFEVDRMLATLAAERCTAAYLLPPMLHRLLHHPRRADYDLSRLRTGILTAPDPQLLETAVTELGISEMFSSYGMTETSSAVTRTYSTDPLEVRLNTHGRPLPDIAVRIADPASGAELRAGEVGEIQVKGYCVTQGYYADPAATRAAFTAEGWFKTGDAGLRRPDGNFRFLHRIRDGYKHKGFNVSTAEVESVLEAHPAVAAAAVTSIPDPVDGEAGVAFVILRDGAAAEPRELLDFLRARVAGYKLPAQIFHVQGFPLTGGTGKVQKFRLREQALALVDKNPPEL